MDRSLGLSAVLAAQTMTATDAPPLRLDGETAAGLRPPASTGPAPSSPGPSGPALSGSSPNDPLDRLAERMNDVVVRRIFAAGLDLQAALGLIGERLAASDHRAAGKICHASDELDLAIRDLRHILFERDPP